ncbi:AAA family ATPase [Kutzneria sp. 744]|uniref:ATP-binding protein n=1 Tax=Kutzneria sp. (strain 744) TaxID=345341 RepID=UPI0003EED37A|nr:AAA family ATPase [Kutzneria sp. 744]EWM18519.1 regulatory protein [Kutzneria sp. 744]
MTLVERERELAAIHDMIGAVAAGHGRTVLVEGPPGIGKTAVLATAGEQARGRGLRVLTSVGGELEQDLPFTIVRQLFEPPLRTEDRAELLAGAAGLAEPVFGRSDPSQGDVVYGLYWLCANLSASAPLLLVVDDLHWADGPSLRFLSHLSRRIADLPVLLLLAGRPGPVLDGLVGAALGGTAPHVIRLRQLSDEAVGVLVRRDLSAEAEDEFCQACAVATGGNPFLLAEAVTNLRENGTRPIAAEAHRVRSCGPTPFPGPCWPESPEAARMPSGSRGRWRCWRRPPSRATSPPWPDCRWRRRPPPRTDSRGSPSSPRDTP